MAVLCGGNEENLERRSGRNLTDELGASLHATCGVISVLGAGGGWLRHFLSLDFPETSSQVTVDLL
jgi:hypothetical protein